MVKTDDPAEFLAETALAQGVSCATVKDGHIFVFTRKKLQEILAATDGKELVTVFVKRPNMVQ